MTAIIFKYPLDLLGTSTDNKVIDEAHTIGTRRGRLFAADYGPFYGTSVVLVDADTGKELTADQYTLAHFYKEASDRTGQGVYAAVVIKDPDVGTNILFSAQMVGGEFSYSYYALKQAIDALANDERPVAWGELIGIPSQFNPAPHKHSIYDTYRWEHMVWATNDVAAAIRDGDTASRALLIQQITDKLLEFETKLNDSIDAIRDELNFIKAAEDVNMLINRRYLFLADVVGTLPSITGDVLHGDWVITAKLLSVNPVIRSTDKSIMCINGTDTLHEGVLFNALPEQKWVWNGPSQRWEV